MFCCIFSVKLDEMHSWGNKKDATLFCPKDFSFAKSKKPTFPKVLNVFYQVLWQTKFQVQSKFASSDLMVITKRKPDEFLTAKLCGSVLESSVRKKQTIMQKITVPSYTIIYTGWSFIESKIKGKQKIMLMYPVHCHSWNSHHQLHILRHWYPPFHLSHLFHQRCSFCHH